MNTILERAHTSEKITHISGKRTAYLPYTMGVGLEFANQLGNCVYILLSYHSGQERNFRPPCHRSGVAIHSNSVIPQQLGDYTFLVNIESEERICIYHTSHPTISYHCQVSTFINILKLIAMSPSAASLTGTLTKILLQTELWLLFHQQGMASRNWWHCTRHWWGPHFCIL